MAEQTDLTMEALTELPKPEDIYLKSITQVILRSATMIRIATTGATTIESNKDCCGNIIWKSPT